jgi:hypothetical protein
MGAGRPAKYNPEFNELVEKFCKLGATDEQIGELIGVTKPTVIAWRKKYPEFARACTKGKLYADANVADALYQRAIGYEHEDVVITNYKGEIIKTPVIKKYPPDTGAAFLWLKNRQPELWRQHPDVIKHEHSLQPLKLVKASDYIRERGEDDN